MDIEKDFGIEGVFRQLPRNQEILPATSESHDLEIQMIDRQDDRSCRCLHLSAAVNLSFSFRTPSTSRKTNRESSRNLTVETRTHGMVDHVTVLQLQY